MRKFLPAPVSGFGDGAVMVNYGRYHKEAIATVFQMLGGVEAYRDWARGNPDDFYNKHFLRTVPKEVEVSATQSVEDLLRQLDSNTIDVTPKEVDEAA